MGARLKGLPVDRVGQLCVQGIPPRGREVFVETPRRREAPANEVEQLLALGLDDDLCEVDLLIVARAVLPNFA